MPHEGLHYTKKHVLRVQVLFSVRYCTIQTSERLLNGLFRVVLGGSGVVVSDPWGQYIIQAVRRLFNGLLSGTRWFCGGP